MTGKEWYGWRRSAAGGSGSPRRPAQYAWFITAPLALLAIVFSTAIGEVSWAPEGFGEWGLAFVLFVAMTGISIPVLNVIVRRRSGSG